MVNFTDEELEIAEIIYRQGLKWGENLKFLAENGKIDLTKPIHLILPLGEIKLENFSKRTRFLIELGSTRTGVVANSAIAGVGCLTAGSSLMGLKATKNPAAKAFYCLSVVCSSTAITTAGFAVLARTCQISETAALSEACATAFMVLGNQANVRALQLEGKPVPPHLNKYVRKGFRRSAYNNNGACFVMPGVTNHIIWSEVIERIPFETIGRYVGIGLSIYGYSRLIIVSYRYSQQFFSKFKAKRQSLLLIKQIRFVVIRLSLRVDTSMYYKSSA
jgi:hypothetical protein